MAKKKGRKIPNRFAPRPRTREEIRIERFVMDQIDMYIKLHKEHEKDINYIG
jgi:hypothetical protein